MTFSCRKPFVIRSISILMISLVVNFSEAEPVIKQQKPDFQLHILKISRDQLKLYGEDGKFEQSWNKLKTINLSSCDLFVITESDIESYNWPDQSIMLTPKASLRLVKLMKKFFPPIEESPLPRRKDWFYLGMVNIALTEQIFLIVFKGKKLYGGIFIYPESARGASYPVIYSKVTAFTDLEPLKLQIMLVIRPEHSVMGALDGYKKLDPSLKKRIELEKVRDFFQQLGKLTHDAAKNRIEPWIPKIKPIIKLEK